MRDESFETFGRNIGLIFVLDVLEEFIDGIVVGDAVEYFWIVGGSDPLNEALYDIFFIDGLYLPGSSGDLIELDEDTVLLGKQFGLCDLSVLLVDDQPGVVDFDDYALQYFEVVIEVVVEVGIGGCEWFEEVFELLVRSC
jgi:hypothetical protein